MPTPKKRKSGNVKKGWIEFRSKNGKRYARRRRWVLKDDGWVKKYIGREHAIPVMTEKQYVNYKRDKARAKQIKQTKHRTRSGSD